MTADPYTALGLTKSAMAADIKKAYRKLVRTSHPDLHPDDAGAEARFKAVTAAHDLLKDPATRARFDAGDIDASGAERAPRTYYRDHADAAGQGFGQGFGPQAGYDGYGDPSDIFAHILRQRGRPGQGDGGYAQSGADLRYTLEVPFLDAVLGSKSGVTLPGGATLEVQIPKGMADGQTLRLRGRGGAGSGGGPAGDAFISLQVRAHPVFRRDGDDIVIVLPITVDEAILGGKVTAPTINGPVSVSIPKGTSSGRILRLRGRGVSRANGQRGDQSGDQSSDQRGDQLIELRIVAPPEIDAGLAQYLTEWRKTHAHDPRKAMLQEASQ